MMRMISRFMVIMAVVVLAACADEVGRGGREATAEPPIELKEGEQIPLPGTGPTEESPVMTVNVYITDVQSGGPVAAELWLNDELIGSGQSVYTFFLPAQFEGVLRVKEKGYKDFATGIQYTIKRSRTIDAPVRLEKELGTKI